jgi:hypothetical protein
MCGDGLKGRPAERSFVSGTAHFCHRFVGVSAPVIVLRSRLTLFEKTSLRRCEPDLTTLACRFLLGWRRMISHHINRDFTATCVPYLRRTLHRHR